MLYISAQPDQIYFIWQLEVQLRNLHSLNITKGNIQVLVAFNKEKGLNPRFQEFIDNNNHLANFYTYPDLRVESKYTSSIRPNILKQHFERFPELSNKTIMYHDSDILFSRIPQIEDIEINDICYVSDTRNYLDINYIRATSNEDLLDEMLGIVGLSKEKLIQENEQTGGAQYILKGITADFWKKVEIDSENLYVAMREYNRKLWEKQYADKKEYRSKKRGIQSWCADMWAVLWNLWLENKPVQIHSEMDFSWPYSPIEEWQSKAIQHYSGNIEDKAKFFKKSEYLNYMPWYDEDLVTISNTSCSYEIVKHIKARRKELDNERTSFENICIIIPVTSESENINFQLIKRYIQKYIDVNIYSHEGCIQEDYDAVVQLPNGLLIDWQQLYQLMLNAKNTITYNINELYSVDLLFTETFSKVLDIDLLEKNKGKFNIMNQTADASICIKISTTDSDYFAAQDHIQKAYFLV